MLGLDEAINQIDMANSVCCYVHVSRKGDGHVVKRALDFEVEGRMRNWRPKRT